MEWQNRFGHERTAGIRETSILTTRIPSRRDFAGASSTRKAKSFPLPHIGGRSAFQRQDPLGYPDPVRSRVVGDSKKRFKGRLAVDIVCKPFDATVPTMNKEWREAALSARLDVEMAMSRGSRFWQLEHAAWSVVMQPMNLLWTCWPLPTYDTALP
jgi:hypothetical protein